MKSTEHVIVVTGSSRGIGKTIAEFYLEQGWTVFGCSRGESSISHDHYSHHSVDLSDADSLTRFIQDIGGEKGRLDALINNAGVARMNHFLLTPDSQIDDHIAVNLRSAMIASREAAKIMKRNKQGRIINMGTVAVPLALAGEAAYVAAKSGLVGFTRVLARELAPFHITVNMLTLPPVQTNLIRNVPPEKIQSLLDRLAIKRILQPDEIVPIIDFLLQPAGALITGAVIPIGGI